MNSNIWSPKSMNNRSACCKIPYKGYEISIAMDDSCGVLAEFSRSDIRVYDEQSGMDISSLFTDTFLIGDADTLKVVFRKIDELEQSK